MTEHRWKAVRELFDLAAGQSRTEQARLLSEACAGDDLLREEVEALLRADAGNHSGIGEAIGTGAVVFASRQEPHAGDRIGSYAIERELGRGGMGVVYLASRATGEFRQQVALKIAAGARAPGLLARFRLERQILADLSHPNIARLLDGGATPDGSPYVAMEYVNGERITDHCAARNLPLRERLRLVGQVCAAVQYAHRSLVVHRDIKPGNILVTETGEAKLLDFGIAKLMQPAGPDSNETDVRALTPAYSSPEQMSGGAVTTASDIYSLGVVMYEVATGQHPFRNDSAGGREPRLDPSLDQDLWNIVSKAMHPEPERRYASAAALSEDIERYLGGFPVQARPDSLAYRAAKFARRNPVAAGLAAVLALSSAGLGTAVTFQARKAAAERDAAREVSAFLVRIFESADTGKTRGESVTARQLLEAGMRRVDSDLKGQPGVRAAFYSSIGSAFQGLGLSRDARKAFGKEVDLRRSSSDGASDSLPAAVLRLARATADSAKCAEAERLNQEGIVRARSKLQRDSADLAGALYEAAVTYRLCLENAAAEPLFREALGIQRRRISPAGEETAATLLDLGGMLSGNGGHQEAIPMMREALAIRQRLFGDEDARTANAFFQLGQGLSRTQDWTAAEAALERSLQLNIKLYGENHPRTSLPLNGLSSMFYNRKEYSRAEVFNVRALAIDEKVEGPEGPNVALQLNNLASLYQAQGELAKAEPLFRRSIAIRAKLYGAESSRVAVAKVNLGSLLLKTKQVAQGKALMAEGVAAFEKSLGSGHEQTARARFRLAQAIFATEGWEAAAGLMKRAMEDARKAPHERPQHLAGMEADYKRFLAAKK